MITSLQNETLKRIRRLQRCKGDHALLEGPHLLREALDAGLRPELVLVTPKWAEARESAELLARLDVEPRLVDAEVLERVMDADSPRGVLTLVSLPRAGVEALPKARATATSATASAETVTGGLYVFADGLQDPGNLGALARVLEAAGGTGLALAPGCAHPNHPRALRASAGSLLRLPVGLSVSCDEVDKHLGATAGAPVCWLALEPRDGVSLYEAPLDRGPLVLALGAEGPGLSSELRRRADVHLTIPMAEPVESLNAVVAAALVLFEVRRRHAL